MTGAEIGDGGFEEGEDLGDQVAIGDSVVHPDGHRHHLAAVLFTELSPVDDWLVVEMAVRKLHIQRIV